MWYIDLEERFIQVLENLKYDSSRNMGMQAMAKYYSGMAAATMKEEYISKAEGVLENIHYEEEKNEALYAIASALTKIGTKKNTQALLIKAEECSDGITDPFHSVLFFTDLGVAWAVMNNYSKAKELTTLASRSVPRITDNLQRSEAISHLSRGIAEMGAETKRIDFIHIATNLTNRIYGNFYRARACASISLAFSRLGEDKKANSWYTTARELSASIPNLFEYASVAAELIQVYAQITRAITGRDPKKECKNMFLELGEKVADIKDLYFQGYAWFKVSKSAAQLGMKSTALRYLRNGIGCALRVKDTYNKSMLYSHSADPLTRTGRLYVAAKALKDALDLVERVPDEFFRSTALSCVAEDIPTTIPMAHEAIMFLDHVEYEISTTDRPEELVPALEKAEEMLMKGRIMEAVESGMRILSDIQADADLGSLLKKVRAVKKT